jgi:hypothetical protein
VTKEEAENEFRTAKRHLIEAIDHVKKIHMSLEILSNNKEVLMDHFSEEELAEKLDDLDRLNNELVELSVS